MNSNDITAISRCILVLNICDINPAYDGQYSISSDIPQGIFNLTIINVTAKDNGRKLVCSDGSHTDSITIRVRGNDYLLNANQYFV
jgi:hypothetical protein